MKSFNTETLSNGIKVITRKNPNTPRTSINLFMNSGTRYVDFAGTANLTSRLLLQGTEIRTAEDIANELDFDGIEMNVESKQDYLRARTLFLNEDMEKALEVFEDALKYSTFANLDKEVRKLEGELKLDLDSPKTLAFDNLIKNIFPDHPYGYSHLKILEDLSKIDSTVVQDFYYKKSLSSDKIIISVVGDIEHDSIVKALNQKFGSLEKISAEIPSKKVNDIKETKTVTIAKEDSAQAQIIQGWLAPDIKEADYPAMLLLNTILGAGGLSCRLFLELRDKKGLAYTVRSSYEPLKDSGIFTIYIGTAPHNIKECIYGFDAEIKKLQNILVSEEELVGAKNNYLGKRAFFHETNSQQAYYLGFYESMGMGAACDFEIAERVKKITAQEIQAAANKYFSQNSIISVLAPQKYLI